MPRMSLARKKLLRLARLKSGNYPIGTVAYYGPDDQFASKVAVGIVDAYEKVLALERWFATSKDVRMDETIDEQIVAFLDQHQVSRVVMTERIIGCPHEEGVDYPEGEWCPKCPFWKGRDRWSGVTVH